MEVKTCLMWKEKQSLQNGKTTTVVILCLSNQTTVHSTRFNTVSFYNLKKKSKIKNYLVVVPVVLFTVSVVVYGILVSTLWFKVIRSDGA